MAYPIQELSYTIKGAYHETLKELLINLNQDVGPLFLIDDVNLLFSREKYARYDIKYSKTALLLKVIRQINKNDPYFYLKKNYTIQGSKGSCKTGPYHFSASHTISFFKEYVADSLKKMKTIGKIGSMNVADHGTFFFSNAPSKSKLFLDGWLTTETDVLEFTNDKGTEARVHIGEKDILVEYGHESELLKKIETSKKSIPDSSLELLIHELETQSMRTLESLDSREGLNRFKAVTFNPTLGVYIIEKGESEGKMIVRAVKS